VQDNLLGAIAFAEQLGVARSAVPIQAWFVRVPATLAIAAVVDDEHRRSGGDDFLDTRRAISGVARVAVQKQPDEL
jgi:hypothetical protein